MALSTAHACDADARSMEMAASGSGTTSGSVVGAVESVIGARYCVLFIIFVLFALLADRMSGDIL